MAVTDRYAEAADAMGASAASAYLPCDWLLSAYTHHEVRLSPVTPVVGDVPLGGVLSLFAVGEFVQYFLYKINARPREWRAMWQRGRMPPARLRRELRRAAVAVRRSVS